MELMKTILLMLLMMPLMASAQISYYGKFFGNGAGVTNVNAGVQSYTTVENFGALPMHSISDAVGTGGSSIVTSATANFNASEIGWEVVLYTNVFQTNYIISTITAVNSSSSINIGQNVVANVSSCNMNFGTNCISAFTNAINYCYTNKVANLLLTNSVYLVDGQFVQTGTNQLALITFPYQTSPSTLPIWNLNIVGVCPENFDFNGFLKAYSAPRTGSIIYCPTRQTSPTNCFVFGLNGPTESFNSVGVFIKNIGFMETPKPQLSWFQNSWGGHLDIRESSFYVDFAANHLNDFSGGSNNATAVVFANGGNSGFQYMGNDMIVNYDTAVAASEHATLHNVMAGNCGVGLAIASIPGAGSIGVFADPYECINCVTNITFPSQGFGRLRGYLYCEVSGGNTLCDIFVPNDGAAQGDICVSGDGNAFNVIDAGVPYSTPSSLHISYVDFGQNTFYQTYGRFQGGAYNGSGAVVTNASQMIQIGGPLQSGNKNPVGLYYNTPFGQSVQSIGPNGQYVFDTNGNNVATWNIGGLATAGTQYTKIYAAMTNATGALPAPLPGYVLWTCIGGTNWWISNIATNHLP